MFLAGDLDLFVKSSNFIRVSSKSYSMTVGLENEAWTASVSGESFGDGLGGLVGFLDGESVLEMVIFELHYRNFLVFKFKEQVF
jgi:hypothetical protein